SYIQAIYDEVDLDALTLSLWVRPTGNQDAVLAKLHSITTPTQSLTLALAANGAVSTSGAVSLATGAQAVLADTWQHIGLVIDESGARLAVNGAVLDASVGSNLSALGDAAALTIGGDSQVIVNED